VRTRLLATTLALALVSSAHGQTTASLAPVPAPPKVPAGMQYLYGSGEAAAISRQAWRGVVGFARQQTRYRPRNSVVLAAGTTPAAPGFVPCGRKPLAAVFDVDETVLLNIGAEYDQAAGTPYSGARWNEWERTGAGFAAETPGAVEALGALRKMGVTVIFNTNRVIENADGSEKTIEQAGLGRAKYFPEPGRWREQTLYLAKSTSDEDKKKDGRRATIAAHYCVILMGGDQLGDFSDLFNQPAPPAPAPAVRRNATGLPSIAKKWGAGWFVLPNPVYGSGLAGTIDQVFPDHHWPPVAGAEK
jgi:5'-nucleotidase (lipoprotein e(P4) family)